MVPVFIAHFYENIGKLLHSVQYWGLHQWPTLHSCHRGRKVSNIRGGGWGARFGILGGGASGGQIPSRHMMSY